MGSKRVPKTSVNSVDSVRDKSPQRVSSVRFFSQNYTEEQNTQAFTETLSQPISQNLTANFSWNALCSLYAEGLLWARNVRQKAPWALCALWEKSLRQLLSNSLFLTERHRWTEHTAFHRALAGGRTHRTLQPILAETLCVLCMPEAFCGLEICAKKLRELCALCERKNSPANLIGIIS